MAVNISKNVKTLWDYLSKSSFKFLKFSLEGRHLSPIDPLDYWRTHVSSSFHFTFPSCCIWEFSVISRDIALLCWGNSGENLGCFCFCFLIFLGPHPQHMEVPRLLVHEGKSSDFTSFPYFRVNEPLWQKSEISLIPFGSWSSVFWVSS